MRMRSLTLNSLSMGSSLFGHEARGVRAGVCGWWAILDLNQ